MDDIANILKNGKGSSLMVVFPHPDDESFATGGLLLKAKECGWQTIVVTLTKGDAGKNYLPNLSESLAKTRTQELRNCAKTLKVDVLELGNFPDANLRGTENLWSDWLTKIVTKYNPQLIISYDHSGVTGHPDHISLSIGIKKLIQANKIKTRLFYVTFPKKVRKFFPTKTKKYFVKPSHYLNYGLGFTKLKSLLVHRSQGFTHNKKLFLFIVYLLFLVHTEWYHEVDLTKKYSYRFVDFPI